MLYVVPLITVDADLQHAVIFFDYLLQSNFQTVSNSVTKNTSFQSHYIEVAMEKIPDVRRLTKKSGKKIEFAERNVLCFCFFKF